MTPFRGRVGLKALIAYLAVAVDTDAIRVPSNAQQRRLNVPDFVDVKIYYSQINIGQ